LLRPAAGDNADGFNTSEVTGAGMRTMAVGLSMGQIQSVTGQVMAQVSAYARAQVGAETVDKTVVEFPGLSQFI
jgi:hypothetical protein